MRPRVLVSAPRRNQLGTAPEDRDAVAQARSDGCKALTATVPLVPTALVSALAKCCLRGSLRSTADGVAVSVLLVPALSW